MKNFLLGCFFFLFILGCSQATKTFEVVRAKRLAAEAETNARIAEDCQKQANEIRGQITIVVEKAASELKTGQAFESSLK